MNAILEQMNNYRITIDGRVYEDLKIESEWEGLVKLSGKHGQLILDIHRDTSFEEVVKKLGKDAVSCKEVACLVLKASPNFLVK